MEPIERGHWQLMPGEGGGLMLSVRTPSGWRAIHDSDEGSYRVLRDAIDAALGEPPRYTAAEVEAAVLPFVAETADWVERPDAAAWMAEIMARLDSARAGTQEGE